MDRNKTGPRSSKSKIGLPHTSELFALGSKTTSNREDTKNKVISTNKNVSDRKRESSTTTTSGNISSSSSSNLYSGIPSKKLKLSTALSSTLNSGGSSAISINSGSSVGSNIGNVSGMRTSENTGSNSNSNSSSSAVFDYWEQVSIECEPVDLSSAVLNAIEIQDNDTVIGLICGAIKLLLTLRSKPDYTLTLSLLYLAKLRPIIFSNEIVASALMSALKRDLSSSNYSNLSNKSKNYQSLNILIINLLSRGFHNKQQWPEQFLRLYIDDAINERAWIDYEDCSSFVENICSAFGTRIPPKYLLQSESNTTTQPTLTITSAIAGAVQTVTSSSWGATKDPQLLMNVDEESEIESGSIITGVDNDNTNDGACNTVAVDAGGDVLKFNDTKAESSVLLRFSHIPDVIEKLVIDAIKEQLNRRQASEGLTRNFFKFLSSVCGLVEVRALIITRLEIWLHNPKLARYAQELLTYVFFNVTSNNFRDHDVLTNLVKIRMKSKPVINIFMVCLKEIINLQPDILNILIKLVVQNELSNSRNSNNMGMLASIFQTKPEESARYLAEIYHDFLLQRDDCHRTLRVFLRELVKLLRYDIKLFTFCKTFVQFPDALNAAIESSDLRERIFSSMVDLLCLCMLLCISPQVREANNLLRSGRSENRASSILIEFYEQMSHLQCDILQWIYQTVPKVFKPSETEYSLALHKILMQDIPDHYTKGDQWPQEPERSLLLRIAADIPLHQDSILYIILIGITKEIPFKVPDSMELIEQIIRRAANLKIVEYPVLYANKLEIIDFLFSMAEYHHPENIALPIGYEPPKLAISTLYWKTWNILLLISAHNPSTFGEFCYDHYPQLVNLMEMCITNQFPMYKSPDDELQVIASEKSQILEFETHLAAATSKVVITDQTSLLLSQLMLMDPAGCARRPPIGILEMLQSQNITHKLGHLLCRSRKPDLLLDIIQRYGTSQSMPWLTDLVQNSESDFNHLPIQCLCEFLLTIANQQQPQSQVQLNSDNNRDLELLVYLQKVITDPNRDSQNTYELLEYFLRRLSSPSKQNRIHAIRALRLLLSVFNNDSNKPFTNIDIKQLCSAEYIDTNWLLHSMPLIQHFDTVRFMIILQLRAACQIENNPHLVMMYIQFIAANTLHDSAQVMLEHMMDMSQLIVERSTLFSFIIPNDNDKSKITIEQVEKETSNELRLQTLNCLFIMFNNFLIKIRDTALDWCDYTDLLQIHFSDDTELPIHLHIVQAFIILLTYSTIIPNSQPNLDYWFPPGATPPKAFLKDTQEQIQILPDWLKLKVIRSSVERLVDAVLLDLSPDQIILFLQNFGTPVNSMSKLLALLDRAVIEQFECVKAAIMNKAYLAQLIEIQQARGAKNGHIAVQALDLRAELLQEFSHTEFHVTEKLQLDLNNDQQHNLQHSSLQQVTFSRTKEVEEVVEIILTTPENTTTKINFYRIRNLMQQLIAKDIPNKRLSMRLQKLYGTPNNMQQYTLVKVCEYLHRTAKCPRGVFYLRNINHTSSVYCLFRSLLARIPSRTDTIFSMNVFATLTQAIDECLQQMNNSKLNFNIFQMLLNKRKYIFKHEPISGFLNSNNPNTSVCDMINLDIVKHEDLKELLQKTFLIDIENKGKKYLNEYYKKYSSSYLIDAIISVLNTIEFDGKVGTNQEDFNISNRKIGLLVDWIADIDSELVVSKCSDQQLDLLFTGSFRQFRFYLLSLLSHQVSWHTLRKTMNKLFRQFNAAYDPSSVLHFVAAIIHNPKLWQGRDKSTSKHEQMEYVLKINTCQIQILTDYILKECSTNCESSGIYCINNDLTSDTDRLNSRIQLLLHVMNQDKTNLKLIVNYINSHPTTTDIIKRKFLQQLYINIPPMRFLLDDFNEVFFADATQLIGCEADKISNYIITIISGLITTKDYQNMSQEIELMIRKLAASHPSLILRQLSVMAALLQGRADLELYVLRNNYHISLFNHVIGILELLQPQIFEEPYENALHQALECYFILLKCHGHSKDISLLMFRFMELLQSYTTQNANRALKFIEPHAELMQYLATNNRNMIPLQQIVHGVTLLKHKTTTHKFSENITTKMDAVEDDIQNDDSSDTISLTSTNQMILKSNELTDSTGGAAAVILAPYSKQILTPQHWPQLINIVLHRNDSEIIAALQEIELITTKRIGLLDPIFERILELLQSSITTVRNIAHLLLVRHLKHNPGNSVVNANALIAYLKCLRHQDTLIGESALETLTDIVICLQEYAPDILSTTFDLYIQSKLQTYEPMRKCILTLKMQHGC